MIVVGLVAILALSALSAPRKRWFVEVALAAGPAAKLAGAPTPSWLVRGVVVVVQVMATVPALWHVWLAQVGKREASLGHGEEAIFAAIGDPVVMRVVTVLGSMGAHGSVAMLNVIGITTWVIIGAVVVVAAQRVGNVGIESPDGKACRRLTRAGGRLEAMWLRLAPPQGSECTMPFG